MPYVLTCLTCLRAFVSMLRSCLHFLRALRAFTLFACLNFFTHFTCLHFFMCLMCLHFFTCLTYFQFFTCLNYLHFLCAFIFLTCFTWLDFFTCLQFSSALHAFFFCVLAFYLCICKWNSHKLMNLSMLLLNSVIYQRSSSAWFFPFLKRKMLITFNPFVSNAPFTMHPATLTRHSLFFLE